MKIFYIYFALINIAALIVMGADKLRACRHRWRIPERVLFLMAFLGGSVGSVLGMLLFRHKTQHTKFVIGMPLLMVAHVVLCIVLSSVVAR